MNKMAEKVYLTIGEGGIDPAIRVKNGETNDQDLDRLYEALLSDELYDNVDQSMMTIPSVVSMAAITHAPVPVLPAAHLAS